MTLDLDVWFMFCSSEEFAFRNEYVCHDVNTMARIAMCC